MSRNKIETSPESTFLKNATKGQVMYSTLPDKDLTARACYYKRKIATNRMFAVYPQPGFNTEQLTKITILE